MSLHLRWWSSAPDLQLIRLCLAVLYSSGTATSLGPPTLKRPEPADWHELGSKYRQGNISTTCSVYLPLSYWACDFMLYHTSEDSVLHTVSSCNISPVVHSALSRVSGQCSGDWVSLLLWQPPCLSQLQRAYSSLACIVLKVLKLKCHRLQLSFPAFRRIISSPSLSSGLRWLQFPSPLIFFTTNTMLSWYASSPVCTVSFCPS